MSGTTAAPSPYLPVREDWLAPPARDRSWNRNCRSSIRTIICGTGPAGATCWTICWPTSTRGHNIVATVFVQCRSMHRAGGPRGDEPVGETEFVNGVAAMRRQRRVWADADLRRHRRPCRSAAGRARAEAVLEAHIRAGGGRFRGIRHITAWDADPTLLNPAYAPPPGLLADRDVPRRGLPRWRRWTVVRRVAVSSADRRAGGIWRRRFRRRGSAEPCRRAAGDRRLCRQARGGVRRSGRPRSARWRRARTCA